MVSTSQAALRTRLHNTIDRREAASIEAVRDWLRRPSFSDTGEGMAEAAVYTRDLLAQIAPDAQIVPTAGYPMVLGTVKSKQPDAPTLMVYGLYDVTPLVAEEWSIDDPMRAPIVDAADIGITAITGRVLVGRGANNHKGPVLSSILAVKAMLDVEGDVPVNLIYVIEGEEEIGSPSMAGFVAEHYTLLSTADGVWLPCMQQSSIGSMVLRRAYKGALFADLECKGGEWGGTLDAKHIWAGHSAWIASPAMQLIRGLATLFDDEQRATIDGLDEAREIYLAPDDPAIQKIVDQFRDNPHWQDNLLTNLNVRRLLGDKPLAEHLAHYMVGTTFNIQGLDSGYQGPTFYTNMPGSATAKVDVRFTPGISHEKIVELIQAHLYRRGYSGIEVKNWRGYDGAPELPDVEDTLLQAARVTAEKYNVPLRTWPIANNCCPASLLANLDRQIPFSIAGLGHGARPHAPDEYITVESINKLMHWTVDYLTDWAEIARATR